MTGLSKNKNVYACLCRLTILAQYISSSPDSLMNNHLKNQQEKVNEECRSCNTLTEPSPWQEEEEWSLIRGCHFSSGYTFFPFIFEVLEICARKWETKQNCMCVQDMSSCVPLHNPSHEGQNAIMNQVPLPIDMHSLSKSFLRTSIGALWLSKSFCSLPPHPSPPSFQLYSYGNGWKVSTLLWITSTHSAFFLRKKRRRNDLKRRSRWRKKSKRNCSKKKRKKRRRWNSSSGSYCC